MESENRYNKIRMNIGKSVVEVECADKNRSFCIEDDYCRFLTDKKPNIHFRIHYDPKPSFDWSDLLFDSKGLWRFYKSDNKYLLRIGYHAQKKFVEQRVVVIEPDLKSGDIYVRSKRQDAYLYPWSHPLDEIYTINYLAMNGGSLIHACGVNYQGRGFVFAGVSGAGKSTISKLWMKYRTATILSDDRIIIQKEGARFKAYGTPWHGEVDICSPGSVPVEKLFIIKHGKKNEVRKISEGEMVSTLLVRSFATYWNSSGMNNTLKMYQELINKVEAYELSFVPDESVIKCIEQL